MFLMDKLTSFTPLAGRVGPVLDQECVPEDTSSKGASINGGCGTSKTLRKWRNLRKDFKKTRNVLVSFRLGLSIVAKKFRHGGGMIWVLDMFIYIYIRIYNTCYIYVYLLMGCCWALKRIIYIAVRDK